jgi:ABC-type proline/glycine betaine transport system ATPase subunit
MNSAYKISDRIMMLYGGNIIFNGMPDEVRSTKNKYVKQFVEGSSQEPIHTDRTFENVYAKFDNISGVTKKAKIKIAGVDIGILRGISLEDSQAKLK